MFRHFLRLVRLAGGLLLTVIMIALFPAAALASQTSALMVVSATVLSVCGVAATPLVFGNYSGTGTSPTDATSTITATCTAGVNYTISLDNGLGTGGTVATRVLTNGANTLNYTIYKDSGRSAIWGDGTSSTSTVTGTGTLIPQIITAYGRIPASQLASAGAYLDTVTVTLTY